MRHLARPAVLAILAAAALLPVPDARADAFEGRWRLVVDRPNWEPREARGILELRKGKSGWTGTVTFDILMNGQQQEVIGIRVDGSSIEFKLGKLGYSFVGESKGGGFEGSCETTRGQVFTFTAKRDVVTLAPLFEKDLPPAGFLARGDPKALGLDEANLYDLVRDAEAADSDALVILKDGKVAVERTFGREGGPIPLMSVTKFVTAFAAALLLEEGTIPSLEAPISTWFPEWREKAQDRVLLRHLLTHTSGIAHGETAEALNAAPDKVTYVRGLAAEAPGTSWSYNNEAAALLSGVVAAAAGKPCDAFLEERLFRPLGIREAKWDRDGAGNTITYAQLSMTARDVARIGQLVADRGNLGSGKAGKPIFPAKAIDLMASEATTHRKEQGLLWFRILENRECVGVRHDGWLGQHLVVCPKLGLVGVRLRRGAKGSGKEFGMGDFPLRLRNCVKR